jgi:hypothetical protein
MRHLAAASAALCFTACISLPARTPRTGEGNPSVTAKTSIQQIESERAHRAAVGKTTFEHHPEFMLGFVEFDDQGWFFNDAQFVTVKNELERELRNTGTPGAKPAPAILVAFIHGWRHNASVCDRDVVCFREVLRGLSVYEKARARRCKTVSDGPDCQERRIAGVLLGWRGSPVRPTSRSFVAQKVEWLNVLSFFSRKSAAHNIGQAGQLASVIGWLQGLDQALSKQASNSRLVLAGHSFGGAMLFSGVSGFLNEQIAESRFDQARPSLTDCNDFRPRGVGDLIILLNPAFEALRYHSIHKGTTDVTQCKEPHTVMMTLASKNDRYNQIAFPIGRWLSTAFDHFTKKTDQRKQTVTALGHYEPFRTHELVMNTERKAPVLFEKLQAEATVTRISEPRRECSCQYQVNDDAMIGLGEALYDDIAASTQKRGYAPFQQTSDAPPSSVPPPLRAALPPCDAPACLNVVGNYDPLIPFAVVSTDPKIIDGHSGIYNAQLLDFIVRSLASTDRLKSAAP